ncbi:phosphoacetylglucosamine mutase-like [Saccoglossus kowalevskii]|uniref:Phosphoacetylglucosamine mutase-like n=1 Tax=Saccoglossus kowalevskii TaxID=10224 RepID=A0ABM0MD07_SACKO|nr:PREDICTED: phosphoacetylglucosamine mutase-like [Saccoglossus kowalevskii]
MANNEWWSAALRGASQHTRTDGRQFTYGTAGFRARADTLDSVLYRMGLLAVLRSKATKAAVGVMITASHNPECDNGVKLIEPMGEMLVASWEKHATLLANEKDGDIVGALQKIVECEMIDVSQTAHVIIARDTRPSSPGLSQALTEGVQSLNAEYKDYVPVACVATGVKHLHHRALDYDIGVYFEANGHGTVLFSKEAEEKINAASKNESLAPEKRKAAENLSNFIDITNQTVGDALADMLIVETILAAERWHISDWNAIYTELPNRQVKVKVKDRSVIQTTDAERRTTSPAGLQSLIDELVAKYKHGRSFVRPSGTEDIVRVYAEADTQENADMLAYEVCVKVFELADGVGDVPQRPK